MATTCLLLVMLPRTGVAQQKTFVTGVGHQEEGLQKQLNTKYE